MSRAVSIFNKNVGDNHPVFIIAEVGLNHNGSIDIAKKLIDAAVEAGCDAVKFQKRDVDNLATKDVLDAKDSRFPEFGGTYREIREYLEFDEETYRELMNYAEVRGIAFLVTPFDVPSAVFLEELNVRAYKLASHSLTNISLLRHIAALGKPTILSTGMAHLKEVDLAVDIFRENNHPLILMHCVSAYPTPVEASNLKIINFYKERYDMPVGYSGHEIGHFPTLGSVFHGADAVERHITLDTGMIGFDHKLSLNPEQLKEMVRDIRLAELMTGTGEKYLSEQEIITRNKYHVSIVSVVEIRAGQKIDGSMLTFKNPGTGIESYEINKVIGKVARVDIPADAIIAWEMIE